MRKKMIRLGTRGSPLALVQAEDVKKRLCVAHPDLDLGIRIEIVPIRTTGDWGPGQKDQRLLDLGGNKGLFTKEIEESLQTGAIDMAVHSMKDLASWLPDNLEIAAVLERQDPRDAFISARARTLDELPLGLVIGTSSLRRQSQILARRPDLRVVPLRGNVETRLKKLGDGIADATLLAVAGMARLGVTDRISSIMETDVMLPAAAQGAIGIEIRRGDEDMRLLLAPLNCETASVCVHAERAFLKVLDGSCHTPLAALAKLTGKGGITIEALAARPDGSSLLRLDTNGSAAMAEALGTELGHILKGKLPPNFFAA